MKILFLAVSYESPEQAHSFSCQFRDARLDYRVALVDNTQGVARGRFEREFEPASLNVRCFTAPDNLGYFGGMRYAQGLDWVRDYDPDWTVVSNVDVLFDPDAIAVELALIDPSVTACVAPSIVSQLSGVDLNPYLRVRPHRMRMHLYKNLFRWYWGLMLYTLVSEWMRGRNPKQLNPSVAQRQPTERIYAPHGSYMIFGRGFFEGGGSLAHAPFLFGEEITIAEHARRMDLPVLYIPDIRITHAEHVSTSRLPSRLHHRFVSESVQFLADNYFS